MGRNITNTVDYFPHRVEHKKTLYILERRYGNDGYAVLFKLFELLGKSEGHFLKIEDEIEFEYLVEKMNTDRITVTEILDTLANLGKIDPDLWQKKIIWYQSFVNGLEPLYTKRKRKLPQKPSVGSISVPEIGKLEQIGTEIPDTSIYVPESTQSKVKESKVKESKVKESKVEHIYSDSVPLMKLESNSSPPKITFNEQDVSDEGIDQGRLNKVPIPETLDDEEFIKAYTDYMAHVQEKYRQTTSSISTEQHFINFHRWKMEGHDPVEIINKILIAGGKTIYLPKHLSTQTPNAPKPNTTKKIDMEVYDVEH
jgi:hypothetical protein